MSVPNRTPEELRAVVTPLPVSTGALWYLKPAINHRLAISAWKLVGGRFERSEIKLGFDDAELARQYSPPAPGDNNVIPRFAGAAVLNTGLHGGNYYTRFVATRPAGPEDHGLLLEVYDLGDTLAGTPFRIGFGAQVNVRVPVRFKIDR